MTVTRYYFTAAAAAVAPPAATGWATAALVTPAALATAKVDQWFASSAGAPVDGALVLARQYVSPPLPGGLMSGSIRMVTRMRKPSGVGASAAARAVVRVISGDGTVVRGTLGTYTSAPPQAGTGTYNRPASGAIADLVTQPGDRLLIDLGAVVSQAGRSVEFQNGGNATAADIPWPVTDLVTGGMTWFELDLVDPPNPPTGLTVTDVAQTSAVASWTAPATGAAPTSYRYRIDGGAPVSTALALTAALSGLTPGTTYEIEVQSVATSGESAWTAPVAFTTADPQPPAPGIASQAVLSQAGLDPDPYGAAAPAQQWWDIDAADVATYSAVRSEGLFSYAIGYAAREPLGKPQPLSVGVVLLVPVGDAVAIGDRFLLRLSESLADALDLDDTAAIRATCIVTDVQSDPSRTWTLPGHGPATLYNVTATGFLSRYGAERIDGSGWPTEPVGARIARILGSLGLAGDVDTTGPDVLPPQVEGSHHQLLAPAIDSTTGRVVEQRDGTVDYHAADDRRGTLPALTLDAAEILGENFSWRQSVGDVVNEAEISFGTDTGDKVTVRDPSSMDPRTGVGPYPAQISTVLADEIDAYDLATDLVGRRAWPYYQLPAVTIDLARSGLDLDRLATAYEIANGDRVALTSMPEGSPWDTLPRGCFIEGYTETATAYAWRLSLVVSDPALSGVDLRWIDIPDSDDWQWQDIDPDLTWLDLARIEDPADLT